MYIDLFAGCGGLSLGLYNAGIKGLFAVEKNSDAFSTLEANLIEKNDHFDWPIWLEKKNLDITVLLKDYRDELRELKGNVDIIVGGPPCQGFSMAGQRKHNDSRNHLVDAYIEFVSLVQPEILFFENVHGFTVGFKKVENGKEVRDIPVSVLLIDKLKKFGYEVESEVINMSEYGVPQKRKRFILCASKSKNPAFFFESLKNNRESFLFSKGIRNSVTIKQAIGDLEKKNGYTPSIDSINFMNGNYGTRRSAYQRLMRKNISKKACPDSHRFAKHKDSTISLFKSLMDNTEEAIRVTPSMKIVEGLKKRGVTPLKPSSICPTITSIPDDFIHYSEPRIMTVREHARIQSFPDDFIFKGKYTTGGNRRKFEVPRYTQVANAVPPLFAEQVGLILQEMIDNE
ncbi:DNA cytosine methyltransferase [Listeria booriae]|uniref:DNA cytosine methyltransferase n=1 Tax=Listeria booriae TaxID=1552123 RepID=UPI001C8984C3|nr:DNA cytosine methyltransferase [Listeria booriae]